MLENLTTESRAIYKVSEVTKDIKKLLEESFPQIWIVGEVSNFKASAAGHYYFTLKDNAAQMRVVMFRGQVMRLKFQIEDGQELVMHGHITLYEARGEYQLLADHAEPKGIGALQLAFEQLKQKLNLEGLFDQTRKRVIPLLPRKVGLITSSQGAVLHDMLHVMKRRYPTMDVVVMPVKVQGEGAKEEIVSAIQMMNLRTDVDVMIVGRGGGSLEDLWAFNEEVVVRAIADSVIPVISAVGHETDTTLADYAADLRAPTPSAAAELAVPEYLDLVATLDTYKRSLLSKINSQLDAYGKLIQDCGVRFKDPRIYFEGLTLKLDDEQTRLTLAIQRVLKMKESVIQAQQLRNPLDKIRNIFSQIEVYQEMMAGLMKNKLLVKKNELINLTGQWPDLSQQITHLELKLKAHQERLLAYSPYDTLKKGYALVLGADGQRPIKSVLQIKKGDELTLQLTDGKINVRVV